MAVAVSLEQLVSLPGTRPVWPEQFSELVAGLEDGGNAAESTRWLVLADWLNEHSEFGMERACRWVAKRVSVLNPKDERWVTNNTRNPYWNFGGHIPASVLAVFPQQADRRTLAGLIADTAAALRRLDEERGE